jgi:hypothetical protein
MLVVQGYFDAGRFVPDKPVIIPEKKKTVVTVLDEDAGKMTNSEAWDTFLGELQNIDETLTGSPSRLRLRPPEDIDRL